MTLVKDLGCLFLSNNKAKLKGWWIALCMSMDMGLVNWKTTLGWLGGRLALGETQISVCNSLFFETVQILQRRISWSPPWGSVVMGRGDGHIQLLGFCLSGEKRIRGSKFRYRSSAALHCPCPSWQVWSSLELLQGSRGHTDHLFCLTFPCKYLCLFSVC